MADDRVAATMAAENRVVFRYFIFDPPFFCLKLDNPSAFYMQTYATGHLLSLIAVLTVLKIQRINVVNQSADIESKKDTVENMEVKRLSG